MTVELHSDDAGLDGNAALVAEFLADLVERWSLKLPLFTLGSYIVRKAEERETDRVGAILARDKEDAAEEEARRSAQIELDNGLTVNVHDVVIPPTPEWLGKTAHRVVHVGAENWTDRSAHEPVRTVRRKIVSEVYKLHIAGKLTEREFKACAWYRDKHEAAGLEGQAKTSSFEPKISASIPSNLPFSTAQLEAQNDLDNARLVFPRALRRFFEAVVVEDKSVSAAVAANRAGRHPLDGIRHCADRVADYIEYSTGKSL